MASSNASLTVLSLLVASINASSCNKPQWFDSSVASATCVTRAQKASLRPAKSVSDETCTNDADAPSGLTHRPTNPSVASRSWSFDDAFAAPCFRSQSMALPTSPSELSNAFLHSIMGAPERLLKSFKTLNDTVAKDRPAVSDTVVLDAKLKPNLLQLLANILADR